MFDSMVTVSCAAKRLSAATNGNGFVVEYRHDIMDRVTNIAWRTTSGATIGGFDYEYDAAGRIVSRSHALGNSSQMFQSSCKSYTYDDLDRLASDGGATYTYDAAGNRMTRTEDGAIVTYTLGVGDRLASWSGGAYTYDVAGNVTRIEHISKPTLDLTWNSQYQLVSVSTNGVFAEGYEYDALGRRASTTTLGGTTRHVYDDRWQVIADIDENNNVLVSYVWGEGIDNLLAVKIGSNSYYPLADIQGTIWGYVDSQNNVVACWQYDAWGNVVDEFVIIPALSKLRYRFQCREWSAATGLINFRMRWYDVETGRWLSKDPIGMNGGLNLYAFCAGSPILSVDPTGEHWAAVALGVGGAYLAYMIIRHAYKMKRTMESADVNDLRDVTSKMIDCTEDTMTTVTPIFGPPMPDVTLPLTDSATDVMAGPLWSRVFDRVRPSK